MTPEIKQRIQQIKQGKTPKGYKKTKVGVIPSEWSVKQLKELGVLLSGSTPSRNNYKYWNGTVPWITTGELDNGLVSGSKERITELALNETGIKVFPKHTLLIAMYGQGKTRGTVAILNISAAVNQACAAITLTSDDYKYVYFKIQSLYNDLRRLSNTGNQENLNLDILKQYHLPLHPLPEQTAIAEILTTQDRVIELKEQLLAEKKRQKKYLMQQLLTGKMRLKGFNGKWRRQRIIDICDYVDYRGKTPVKTNCGAFLITAKNVKKGYIDYEVSKEYISKDDYEEVMHRGKPAIGDVLITTEAPCGNVAQVDRTDIALAQRIIKYRGHGNVINNTYLKYYFLSPYFQSRLDENSSGGTVQGIKGSLLHQQEVFFPPLPEQTAIAEILSTADQEIELLQQSIEAEKLKKKSLMQLLLTGIVRVRGGMGSAFQAHNVSS